MSYKKLHSELDLYWRSQLKRVPVGDGFYYTYNKSKWNAPISNMAIEMMRFDMSDVERLLFLDILLKVKRGYDVIESGGIFLYYSDYKDTCGQTSFYKAKKKFIKLGMLLPVNSHKKYFILNPRYVIKLYNPKDQ